MNSNSILTPEDKNAIKAKMHGFQRGDPKEVVRHCLEVAREVEDFDDTNFHVECLERLLTHLGGPSLNASIKRDSTVETLRQQFEKQMSEDLSVALEEYQADPEDYLNCHHSNPTQVHPWGNELHIFRRLLNQTPYTIWAITQDVEDAVMDEVRDNLLGLAFEDSGRQWGGPGRHVGKVAAKKLDKLASDLYDRLEKEIKAEA